MGMAGGLFLNQHNMSEAYKESPQYPRPEVLDRLRARAAEKIRAKAKVLMLGLGVSEDDMEPEMGEGFLYEANDQDVVLMMPGMNAAYLLEGDMARPLDEVQDEELYNEVIRQAFNDMEIDGSRRLLAKHLSGKDPVLEEILRDHLSFNGGKVEAVEKEGIRFYAVSQDGGVRAYEGMKHGVKYGMLEKVECSCGKCTIGEYAIMPVSDLEAA